MAVEAVEKARARAAYSGNRGRSLAEAAEVIGCSQSTLERRIREGEIRAVKISPRRVVVTDAELARILSGDAA